MQKVRKRKLEPLHVRNEHLHKQAYSQEHLCKQESPAQKQARLKKQAEFRVVLRQQKLPKD